MTKTDLLALADKIEALPDIMHARILPIADRETEYIMPASLKFELLAALRARAEECE